MKEKNLYCILTALVLALVLAGCGGEEAAPTAEPEADTVEVEPAEPAAETVEAEPVAAAPEHNLLESCVENYDESIDYFPDKTEVTHAEGFTVEYHNNYKVVTVLTPFAGAAEPAQYILVQCGTPAPEGMDAPVIEVPVGNIVAMSTTYLPALEELGLLDTLVGVDTSLYTTNETVVSMVQNGEVAEIGNGAEVNIEVALDLDPDLIMTSATGTPEYDAHPTLEEAGLPVVVNADYLDSSPLGRAEWVDFIALFYNEEAVSELWFSEVVSDYEALMGLAAGVEERPSVFVNTPFDGTWFMPGGQNYMAQLLRDAGADYLWSDDEGTGSLFLDFESVFDQAADADYWLNIGTFGSLDDLVATDERFAEFAAFQNGRIYNHDAITNDAGGSDFFESGAVLPNVVLADLIKIFHPDLVPDHDLVYYRLVE